MGAKILIGCLLSLFLLSCKDINTKNIRVNGYIIDSKTKEPLRNAKVTVLCWYDAGWDKTDYESRDLITNANGFFDVKFKDGYKIIIASVAPEYEPTFYEINDLNDKLIKVNLKLKINNSIYNKSDVDLKQFILNNTSS